ncbi:PHP domain-containing protein [Fusibacter paucivorans]|uniref:PHP domain-containing protein n=1 Tax=Fusibacter paucivorans TaxID=76009 RepID=A0ABS5PK95_9FIRM|nr:PHP-associated domain-containing protein [Fusibacter paucivorans]MBS7525297.1 PHP domain-containing protein [Fusibacter paucivorans]
MKIDFHTHGKLTKHVPFSEDYMAYLFGEAKTAGLDAICLTEHFNTIGFGEVYAYIRDHYQKVGDFYRAPSGVLIIPGMEMDIDEGGHTLVLGDMSAIIKFNESLAPYKEKGHFLSLEQVVSEVKARNFIFGAAHPFRKGGNLPELIPIFPDAFDFFDLNGKDMHGIGETNFQQIKDLGEKYHKPIVAGSDTHQSFQYGCIYNVFQSEITTFDALRSAIAKGDYNIVISNDLPLKVSAATCIKKSLKAVHALGGNYVDILLKR